MVPLEHDSVVSAPIISVDQDEKEVFLVTQEALEKPLPNVPASIWGQTWGRMSMKNRVLAILALQAMILLTIGVALLAASSKSSQEYDIPHSLEKQANVCFSNHSEIRRTGGNNTNTTTIPSIKRGTFIVPIQFPEQQSSTCLARGNESRAWQCAFDTMLQLSILPSLSKDTDTPVMVTLGPPSNSNRSVHCGQQAPEIGPTALMAINNTGTSDNKPQFNFSAIYNRTVILRQDQLGLDKGSVPPISGQFEHSTFQPGQPLWRCTFNNTILEGFIFTEKDNGLTSNLTDTMSRTDARLPYKLKLLEHRMISGSAPYCEKVVLGYNGDLRNDGERIELALSDTQASSSPQVGADLSCQCQWAVE